jgi:hypothetical protein
MLTTTTGSNTEHASEEATPLITRKPTPTENVDDLLLRAREIPTEELAKAEENAFADGDENGNEFVAAPEVHAEIAEEPVDGSKVEDLSAYDPANFIVSEADQGPAPIQVKQISYLSVRKPTPTEFVRVSTDPAYNLSPVKILKWKKEDKEVQYLIVGKCAREVEFAVPRIVQSFSLSLAINDSGTCFIWPVRVLKDDEENSWLESQHNALVAAREGWVNVASNSKDRQYDVNRPRGDLGDPTWPTESMSKLLKLAFGKRIVDSKEHRAVQTALGVR